MAASAPEIIRTPPDPDDCAAAVLFGRRYTVEQLGLIADKLGNPVIAVPVSVAKAASSGVDLGLAANETDLLLVGHDPSDRLETIATKIRAEVPGADVGVSLLKSNADVHRAIVRGYPVLDREGHPVFGTRAVVADPLSGFSLEPANSFVDDPVDEFLCDGVQLRAVNVTCGPSGSGKSMLELLRAARVSTGSAEPLFGLEAGRPRDVVVISNEMSRGAVARALGAYGADMERVRMVQGDQYTPGESEAEYLARRGQSAAFLRRHLAPDGLYGDLDVALVIVDMLSRELPPGTKMADPVAATQALLPWKSLAETTGAAVQLVLHPNRTRPDNLMDRISMSSEIGKLARVITWTSRIDDDSYAHGIVLANGTETTPARRFRLRVHQLEKRSERDRATVAEPVFTDTDDLVIEELVLVSEAARESKRRGSTTAVTDRQDQLVALVRSKPGRPAEFYKSIMRERFGDVSERTLTEDRRNSGVVTHKAGFGGQAHWYPPGTAEEDCVPVPEQDDDRPRNPYRPRLVEVPS